jgi:hypothetical protein
MLYAFPNPKSEIRNPQLLHHANGGTDFAVSLSSIELSLDKISQGVLSCKQ